MENNNNNSIGLNLIKTIAKYTEGKLSIDEVIKLAQKLENDQSILTYISKGLNIL